ncbi:DUF883 family protein [Allopusillimonas ginsengisoli]|uniref:DUF883 family protein n=1 Tax=Allopusillimonas ginsengisoli TaxID=453575 RepID=UPI0010214953|nr:DUF883 family protein [Allopusillimonas ginsengisoli]TEA79446.1 DUF883 domain-containing protein [Allopusillimonas ginsengisoli]
MLTLFSESHAPRKHRRRMSRDVQKLIASSEDLLHSTASYTGAEVERARTRLRQQLDAARDNMDDWRESASQAVHRGYDQTEEYVREHPWRTAGLALGLAAIVTALLVGNSRR